MKGIAAAFAVGLALTAAPAAHAHPGPQEDDPGWSCVEGGNRVCGPDSDDWGHTPGCYDQRGVLVALWPCHIVTNPDGSADVYAGR